MWHVRMTEAVAESLTLHDALNYQPDSLVNSHRNLHWLYGLSGSGLSAKAH